MIYKTLMIRLYPNQQPQVTAVSLALQTFKQSINCKFLSCSPQNCTLGIKLKQVKVVVLTPTPVHSFPVYIKITTKL